MLKHAFAETLSELDKFACHVSEQECDTDAELREIRELLGIVSSISDVVSALLLEIVYSFMLRTSMSSGPKFFELSACARALRDSLCIYVTQSNYSY
jgi:chaperonin GroEL (HSP60 family)